MTETLKKDRDLVVPGDKIVDSMEHLPGRNCFREGESILAKKMGIVSIDNRVISVIPLNSVYIPRKGDMIIGRVEEVHTNGWLIDINSPYLAFLPLSGVNEYIDTNKTDLARVYAKDDMLYCVISSAGRNGNSIQVSMQDRMSRKFRGGRIVRVNPAKVPRLIGRQGSMISMIKQKTGCFINVGQNGVVWLNGDNDSAVIKVIETIESQSQSGGLTDKISEMLDKMKLKVTNPEPREDDEGPKENVQFEKPSKPAEEENADDSNEPAEEPEEEKK